jgi:hypothetical protein
VYLRGDNGTKVDNGFTADTVTATSNAVLNTITTNGISAFTGSSLAIFATSQNIQFNSATVGFNAVIAGPLSVSSITNVSSINGAAYVPGGGGGASTISTFTNLATSSFTVSSINGAAYPPASVSTWVSTATTPLFLNDNYIDLRNNGSNGLAWGSAAPYSVGVDGPFLFGNTQGALGTTSNANDISLAWDTNKIEMYKKLDMNGNGIGDGSGLLTLSSINVGIAGSTSVGLVAGYVSTGVSILLVSPNQIDLISPTVTRDLVGVGVAQPVIQYGSDTVSGASGSVAVSLGTPYTSVSSYVAFISMMDSTPAETSVTRDSDSQITLSWNSGGGGSHTLSWQTLGT